MLLSVKFFFFFSIIKELRSDKVYHINKKGINMKKISGVIILLFLSASLNLLFSQPTTNDFRSNPSGFGTANWNSSGNWERGNGVTWVASGIVPNASTHNVTIQAGHTITLDMDPDVADLTIESNGEIKNTSGSLQGIAIYGNFACNGTFGSSSDQIAIAFNGSGGTSTVSGTGTIDLQYITKFAGTAQTADVQTDLNLYSTNPFRNSSGATLTIDLNSGTIDIINATSLSTTDYTYDFTAGTVEYSRAGNQTILSTTYNNLRCSGSGTKTLGGNATVNAILSLEGTSLFNDGGSSLSYGASSTLQYAGSTAQTTGDEEFTAGVRNLIIDNSNGVSLHSDKSIAADLTINNGSSLDDDGNTLTVNGSITNNGAHTGNGKIALAGGGGVTITAGSSFGNLEINGDASVNGGSTPIISSSLTQTAGTFTNNGTLTFSDGVTINRSGGTFTNSGTVTFSGTVDVNYTGAVTTGAEVPSSATALNDVTTSAAVVLGGNININGTLNLGGTFTVGGNSLTIKNAITGTPTNLVATSGAGSQITIAGNAVGVLLPSSVTSLHTFILNNVNGSTLQSNLTVTNTLTCSNGILNTSGNTLTWQGTSGNLTESAGSYVQGNLEVAETVGAASSSGFGGIGISITAGADALGSVTVKRVAGTGAAVNVGANSGINRKWEVTPTNAYSSNDRNLTLAWVADDDNGKTLTAMRIWSYNGSEWSDVSGSNQDASSRSITKNTLAAIGAGTTYTFTVTDNFSPLPVELTAFTGTKVDGSVELFWETIAEVNNYGFDVERKPESGKWEKIGFVNGHGNSNSPKQYVFVDDNPPSEDLQYRLKQIDFDGSYEYFSTIVEVEANVTSINEETLPTQFGLSQNYPNPFNPSTTIAYSIPVVDAVEVQHVSLKIYDILGNEVSQLVNKYQSPGNYKVTFSADKMASGLYIYRLTAGDFVETLKMTLIK